MSAQKIDQLRSSFRGEAPLNLKLKYLWQQAVVDALIEFHADRIRDKITAAERSISGRLRQRPADLEELLALRDASLTLQIVFPEAKPQIESLIESIKKSIHMTIPKTTAR
jgi:hypothetical protein